MPRVVIEVPSEIDKEKIEFWIAEGMVENSLKIVLDVLGSGIKLDFEKTLKKFEEARRDVWKEIKERYTKKGLIK